MSLIIKPRTILLANQLLGPSSTGAANGGIIDLTPWLDQSWATELTYYIVVSGVNGSPTSGTLNASFQLGVMTDTSTLTRAGVALFSLDTAQKANLIAEAEDWPSPICSYNTSFTSSVAVKRTIRGFGSICNLHLDASSLAGGTTPTFTVSAFLSARQT